MITDSLDSKDSLPAYHQRIVGNDVDILYLQISSGRYVSRSVYSERRQVMKKKFFCDEYWCYPNILNEDY
jgi:hypothetical protein